MQKSTTQLAWIIAALGCASGEPAAPASEEMRSSGSEEPEMVAIYGNVDGAEARPDPAPAPVPAPSTLPESRASAGALETEPALAAGDSAYAEALALPLGSTAPEPTLRIFVEHLGEQITALVAALAEMSERYDRDAATPALVALSRVRRGDASDLVGARLLEVPFALPTDLQATIEQMSPEARAEIELAVRERLRAVLQPHAHRLFCLAAAHYRAGAEGDLPPAVRARAQLTAYGDAFHASCIEEAEGRAAPSDPRP